MAPARSTRCMTLPPSTLPSPLASFGRANSEYSEIDSRTALPSVILFCRCVSPRAGFAFLPATRRSYSDLTPDESVLAVRFRFRWLSLARARATLAGARHLDQQILRNLGRSRGPSR